MGDRIIVPKSDIVGTPEWASGLIDAIKADHRYSERDVTLFAEHAAEAKLNAIWSVTDKEDWQAFCTDCLGLPAAYVDAIIVGVGVLRGQGHKGPIAASQAQRVAALAEAPQERRQGVKLHNNNNEVMQGTSADYLTARIARDRPDILEGMKAGQYRSVRAAAIDAGIVKPQTRYSLPDDPQAAGRYLAQRVDRAWFDALIDSYYKAIEE